MTSLRPTVLVACAMAVFLGGCAPKYNDAEVIGGNKVGARTIQFDVLAEIKSCTQTLIANGPLTVSCEHSGPGSLAATSTFTLRDLPAGTVIGGNAGRVILQVPESASGFNGTYTGPFNGNLVINTFTTPLAADSTKSIAPEPGTKLVMFDPPPGNGLYRFVVNFAESGAAPSPMPLKVMFVAKVTASGRDYYPPVLPCTNNFAAIPALLLPSLGFYAPIDNTPVATQKGCNNVSYSFGSAAVDVVEFYHAGFDHYFITWGAGEIAALDAGTVIKGWTRTEHKFKAFINAVAGFQGVCRFYIPPLLGDSHYYGRGDTECAETRIKFPGLVEEDAKYMTMALPVAGTCPANTTPVHRVFSGRTDANHRYMTDKGLRDLMVLAGWIAEGDGADLVVMCASA